MCSVGGVALPDDIAIADIMDDPDYYKHNKHIKQCAPQAHRTRPPTATPASPAPDPRLCNRAPYTLAFAPRSNHDVEDIYNHWDTLVDSKDMPALAPVSKARPIWPGCQHVPTGCLAEAGWSVG